MTPRPHHRTRGLYYLSLLCAAAGAGFWYYLDQNHFAPNRDSLMAIVAGLTFLTSGITLVCATSDLWLRR